MADEKKYVERNGKKYLVVGENVSLNITSQIKTSEVKNVDTKKD